MLHEYETAPAGAHKFVDPPEQNELLPVMEHGGETFTVMDLLQMLVHPLSSSTVTEYIPVLDAEIHCDVAPVLHKYDIAPAVAHKFIAPPEQVELLPIMVHGCGLFIVTTLLHELLQPLAFVIVTE